MLNVDNQIVICIAGGGFLGAIAGISTSKPAPLKDKFWRVVAGTLVSSACSGVLCQHLNVDFADIGRLIGISFGLGFAGWHILSMATSILDKLKQNTEDKGAASLLDLFKFFRRDGK